MESRCRRRISRVLNSRASNSPLSFPRPPRRRFEPASVDFSLALARPLSFSRNAHAGLRMPHRRRGEDEEELLSSPSSGSESPSSKDSAKSDEGSSDESSDEDQKVSYILSYSRAPFADQSLNSRPPLAVADQRRTATAPSSSSLSPFSSPYYSASQDTKLTRACRMLQARAAVLQARRVGARRERQRERRRVRLKRRRRVMFKEEEVQRQGQLRL